MNRREQIVRWTARILSLGIVLFWGFFIVAYAIGPERSLPANLKDGVAYAAMVVLLLGLAMAWKWELAGAAVSLGAVLVHYMCNPKTLSFPCVLGPVNALLFFFAWWLSRRSSQRNSAA